MRRFLPLILAVLLGAAVPVLAVSDGAPDDAEHNRRLLDRYRADPDHYARLLRDLQAFQALPPDRQERMRQFDRALHDEDPATQNRLWEVLERYTEWVNRLSPADQKRIEQAADRNERLVIVKELRQNDWIARLPQADREAVLALPEPQRSEMLAQLRKEERQRRQEWVDWANALKAHPDAPNPRPAHPDGLPEVPNKVLIEFFNTELTVEERADLHLRGLDRADKHEALKQAYFKKHPNAVEFWRRKEQQHAK